MLRNMEGTHRLMAQLLYGGGLRLMESMRLRIQDIDFGQGRIFVRGGKGGKDRTVVLPEALRESLVEHVGKVQDLYESDLRDGFGDVYIPEALARKYIDFLFMAFVFFLFGRSASEMDLFFI